MSEVTKEVQDILSYNLKPLQVVEAMSVADAVRDSLMIWGSPGIGKSAIALQYANDNYPLRKDNVGKLQYLLQRAQDPEDSLVTMEDYHNFSCSLLDQETNFIDFRLSQIEPSDLRGIPIPVKMFYDENGTQISESEIHLYPGYIEETGVVWASPNILKLPKDWKGVILFDEINSAMPIVQAASYQLILDRRVGELVLPENALILAAGNRETDGGVTFSLATPLRDRMTHIEMVPDYNDWIENYAIPNMLNPGTIAFIKQTGSRLFNTLSPKDASHSGGSSPRSWTRVSDIENVRKKKGMSSAVYKALIAGRVGSTAGIEYTTYIENMADLPDVMDILNGIVTDFSEHKQEVSKNYFITISLTQKIIEFGRSRNERKAIITDEEWCKYCSNFIEFIDSQFAKEQSELIVHAIRTLTDAGINITYSEVPKFKDFVRKYGPLLRKARQMK
ncbi:ATPase [Cronobacter phage vB_CsaM_GAP32]|uniref:ATPase n=1 Tax=Cronobacter phage vB_CsaM_GAP32 TaxID=1141136 RepID=K4F9K2_9CAUD|nr:ATPase [Cronobacter phage vB_CsaM_GAP32]AFC21660.1 ATPase [Cronobacter phage vB_CsaM_GAP32]